MSHLSTIISRRTAVFLRLASLGRCTHVCVWCTFPSVRFPHTIPLPPRPPSCGHIGKIWQQGRPPTYMSRRRYLVIRLLDIRRGRHFDRIDAPGCRMHTSRLDVLNKKLLHSKTGDVLKQNSREDIHYNRTAHSTWGRRPGWSHRCAFHHPRLGSRSLSFIILTGTAAIISYHRRSGPRFDALPCVCQ